MPLVLADRVRETTTTTGTGTISLAGPVSGFQGFSTAIGNANTTYYTIADAATGAWEVGLGTYTSSGSTLARTTVLSSSNAGAAVNFAAGTKDVFVTQPAERALYLNGAGTGVDAGAASFTANGVVYASSTSALATGSALTFDGTNLATTGSVFLNNAQYYNSKTSGGTNIRMLGINSGNTAYVGPIDSGPGDMILNASSSSANIQFYATGSEQMRLTSTGLGIGTVSPTAKLDVFGNAKIGNGAGSNGARLMVNNATNTATGIQLFQDGIESWIMGMPANNAGLAWSASGSEQMRLTSTGLGIGTSSPAYKLDVRGGVIAGGNGTIVGGISYSTRPEIGAISNHPCGFITNNTTQMLLDTSGNLGIGTSSPGGLLQVASRFRVRSDGFITWGSDVVTPVNTGYLTWDTGVAAIGFNGNGALRFDTNNLERMRLDSSGNLGIGTSSPSNKLVVSNAGANGFEFDPANSLMQTYNRSGGAYIAMNLLALSMAFKTGASPATTMLLDSSGNLGIGTSSPSSFSGYTTVSVNNATNGGIYNILVNGTETARLQAYSGIFNVSAKGAATNLTFETNGAERMRLDTSGNLGLGVTPSAWSGYKPIQAGTGASFGGYAGDLLSFMGSNTYNDNTNWRYILSSNAATRYQQSAGVHQWYNAPSGTAGDPITFTQAATLTASGDYHVARTTTADTTVGVSLFSNGTITAARSSSSNSDLNLYVYSTGAAAARFYVGMGGTVYATSTTITAISDQRLKENIQDIDVGLDAIMALKPRKFDWKAGKGKDKKGDRGWIAQEFEQVFPDMVDTWADPAPEGEEPYKAVNADLIPVLVKALQELKAEFDAYKATHP